MPWTTDNDEAKRCVDAMERAMKARPCYGSRQFLHWGKVPGTCLSYCCRTCPSNPDPKGAQA